MRQSVHTWVKSFIIKIQLQWNWQTEFILQRELQLSAIWGVFLKVNIWFLVKCLDSEDY
jgi:hypothetical protein